MNAKIQKIVHDKVAQKINDNSAVFILHSSWLF